MRAETEFRDQKLDNCSTHSLLTINRGSWFNVIACPLDGRTLMIAAVSAWRLPKLPLECAIEGSLRFVSDLGGDLRHAARRSSRAIEQPIEAASG